MSRVVVVGGGIIGASVASSLARRGAEVVVLDPGPPREGSSAANAGHLVPSHIIPFASPGMVGAGLRSLARRDGAFAINPRLRRMLGPWLAQFAASSTEANVRRGAPALEWLLGTSMTEVDRLLTAGVELDHARDGLIQVFTRSESLEAARHEAAHMRALGYPAEEMPLDALREAEPLVHDAVGAILLTRDGRLNPALLLDALRTEAAAHGAEFRTTTVTGIATGPTAVLTADGPIPADQVVLAAGVWTPGLAATVPAADGWSPRLPILPAKGYSVTVPDVPEVPHRPLLLMDQRLAVTPMGTGLRITGRFELTDPSDRGIPAQRTDALLGGARAALTLPADARATQPWSGLRPATPDGLPLIGRIAPGSPVIVASGHGMLGTTTGPGTGELVAAMVADEELPIDVAPLSPERFGRLPRRVRVRSTKVLHCVESHTEGMPTRVVVGGVGVIPGDTMEARRQHLIHERDDLRTFLMYEPRGHGAMSGAILQPPTRPDADWGVLYIEVAGCLPMCGHGTIGVATVLVETGMVEVHEPTTTIRLDTPAGLVVAEVAVRDGRAERVTIRNVASFATALDAQVDVPGYGQVRYDMAFGGNFYAIVDLDEVGVPFGREHARELMAFGLALMDAIDVAAPPVHPGEPGIHGCHHAQLVAPGSTAEHSRHAMVIQPGYFDRSPCGTGTSARMAQLHARGLLGLDVDFINTSLLDRPFIGRLVESTTVAGLDAVVPTITGSAWVTGTSQYVLDPTDPFPTGFLLGEVCQTHAVDGEPAIQVAGLAKAYGELRAVDGLDLLVERGQCVALLGPNGAGKTTTTEILEGYRSRDAGDVHVLGVDPAKADRRWRTRVGIVLQQVGDLSELTVRESLNHFAGYYPNSRSVDEVLDRVGLTEKADARGRTLSGGQRRRLDVGLGIIGRPELLFLDEPTTGFDPEARREFWALIESLKSEGVTILLTTHYLDEAEALADMVGVINRGRLVAFDQPHELGGRHTGSTRVSWTEGGEPRSQETDSPTAVVGELAARFGGEVPNLAVTRPTLEDMYLSLVDDGDRQAHQ